jgi:hypothetical protein
VLGCGSSWCPPWRTRLADLLEEDPAAAERLRGPVDELRERLPVTQRQWVQHITASAGGATEATRDAMTIRDLGSRVVLVTGSLAPAL